MEIPRRFRSKIISGVVSAQTRKIEKGAKVARTMTKKTQVRQNRCSALRVFAKMSRFSLAI
jgi:hypothetical protein